MLELTVDVEGIYLHGRLTTHRAAESQTKGRRRLENLPVELRKGMWTSYEAPVQDGAVQG